MGRALPPGAGQTVPVPFLSADCRRMPKADELKRIDAWLKVRTGNQEARMTIAVRRGKLVRQEDLVAAAAAGGAGR